jgi:hypothetical protein
MSLHIQDAPLTCSRWKGCNLVPASRSVVQPTVAAIDMGCLFMAWYLDAEYALVPSRTG